MQLHVSRGMRTITAHSRCSWPAQQQLRCSSSLPPLAARHHQQRCCRHAMQPHHHHSSSSTHRRRRALQPPPPAAVPDDAAAAVAASNAREFGDPATVQEFVAPQPPEIDARLAAAVALLPGLGPASRVIDVGSGTGVLVPHLRARGVQDVLAVDLSAEMLAQLAARYPPPSGSCGNDLGVRTWQGDFLALPPFQGPASAVTLNAVFGNLADPHAALLKAALLLAPGGHVLISHPLGRAWQAGLHAERPDIVPHPLPDEAALRALIRDLPLQLVALVDEPDLYAAVLQVPAGYAFPGAPLALESDVVRGFGRGSRQLGVPTANMDPGPLQAALAALPRGVYFGWAQLDPPPGWPAVDGSVHKMVMNVGARPTVNVGGDEAPTVEAHILHAFGGGEEFYGARLRVVVAGFLRPEIRFAGLPALLARIRADIGLARSQLDEPGAAALRAHASFVRRE